MPVVVVGVRRAPAEADREEREDGGDDVAEDSMPAEIRPSEPVAMPVPSLSTTSTAAAAIETSAVRDWPLAAWSRVGVRVLSAVIE